MPRKPAFAAGAPLINPSAWATALREEGVVLAIEFYDPEDDGRARAVRFLISRNDCERMARQLHEIAERPYVPPRGKRH